MIPGDDGPGSSIPWMETRSDAAAFPARPASVPAARQFLRQALTGLPRDVSDRAELMLSELATNAVKHAGSPFNLTVNLRAGQLRVEVLDRGSGRPIPRQPSPDEPTGRGLLIVRTLADDWGIDSREKGKTVWFALAARPSPSASKPGAPASPRR